jgi:hypothetical protein
MLNDVKKIARFVSRGLASPEEKNAKSQDVLLD